MVAILDAQKTLGEALKEFPIDKRRDIPIIVRLLENPASPVALPGKISRLGYYCLHLLLERHLTSFDKAFVVGFTMGNDRKTKSWHIKIFKFFSQYLYPNPYNFTPEDFCSFDLGFKYGRSLDPKIQRIYLTKYTYFTIKYLRERFGIQPDYLLQLRLEENEYRSQYLANLRDRKTKPSKLLNSNTLKISSSIFALGLGLMLTLNNPWILSLNTLKISSSIFAFLGGLILALNTPWSGYGFIFLACSSSQLLIASILEVDKIMIFYSATLFAFTDLLGIYRWLLSKKKIINH
ncbi:MAG: hypothetical protein QNJ18_23945 [Xenococcaceae cyanobacterium MO_167.B52]|nr:hypothetical protein [Xenococcaceae cyanobacterium MO_167.B52]